MLVIKIEIEPTQEARDRLAKLVQGFDVRYFAWEDEKKPSRPRPGSTGQDLGSSLSSAVDQVTRRDT